MLHCHSRARRAGWLLLSLMALIVPAPLGRGAEPGAAQRGLVPVGVAAVDITPDFPVRLNGFGFRRAESQGVNQHLFAKAMAIGGDADKPLIILTVDNLGIPDAIAEEVARRLRKKAGVDRAHIAFTATHTHTAPMLTGLAPTLFGTAIPKEHQAHIDQYTKQFIDWLEQAALNALADRKPATLHWAIGTVNFAANRRTRGGPVDHDLPMLVATSGQGKVRAVLANYACHCVTLSHNMIGGDWAGYAQQAIEAKYPGAVAMIAIGCGADANPSSGVTGDKIDVARAQGQQVADEVARLMDTPLNALTARPKATFSRVELPLDTPRTRAQWKERAGQQGAVGYHAQVNLQRLDRGEKLPEKISYPVQTWAFGDQLAMVFLSGEVVVDYALRLKRELDGHRLWINAYANAAPCYIPSERILTEGGYEGGGAMIYYDLPQRIAPGVEKIIVDEVHRQTPDAFNAKFDGDRTEGSGPMTPQQSLAAIKVQKGFKVELVASEPLIDSPVAIEFGPDGRLWVCEMRDYPMGMDNNYKPGGRIKVLADTDGDGRYDKATVFLENLPFPTGLAIWRKGLLVCAAPDILYAEDTDGDGKADVKRTLFTGFATHNYQARVNDLRYGLDDWMYAAAGLFGGKIKSFNGTQIDLTSRDFRFKPDTGQIEAVTGQSQHGRIRGDWGDWFGCDSGTMLKHYPFQDRYLKRNPNVTPPAMTVHVFDHTSPYRVYPISDKLQLFKLSGAAGGVTSACGAEIYRDTLLSAKGAQYAFTCEPVNLLVHRMAILPKGATFEGRRDASERESEFLASTDTWFRPVEARTGPDGALWITDMYRYVIEHPRWIPPQRVAQIDVRAGSGMGRIYRVLPAGARPRAVPRLDKLNVEELVWALQNPSGVVRDRAQQMLLWQRDKAAVPLLVQLFKQSSKPVARLHALCTLSALGALGDDLLILALNDAHVGVRRQALRLCEGRVADSPGLLDAMLRRTSDQPTVALELALRLGETNDSRAGDALGEVLVRYADDPYVVTAVLLWGSKYLDSLLKGVLAAEDKVAGLGSLVQRIIPLAAAQHDDTAIARLVRYLAASGGQSPQRAHFDMAAALLDALGSQNMTLGKWRDGAQPAVRDTVPADALEPLFAKALEATANDHRPVDDRIAAVALLARHEAAGQKYLTHFQQLIRAQADPQLQVAALRAMARLRDDPRMPGLLFDGWAAYGPSLRVAALDIVLSRQAWSLALLKEADRYRAVLAMLSPAQRQALFTHKSDAIRNLAAKALGRPPATDRAELFERYKQVARMKGDPARGREMFTKTCATCHHLHEVGKAIGPDLGALTDRTPSALLTAILDPSRDVMPQYMGYRITTTDDLDLIGIIIEELSSAVVVGTLDGQKQTLLRNRIRSMASTGLSLMPQGLEQALDPRAMADLFAFINATPATPKTFAGNRPARIVTGDDGALTLPATAAGIFGGEIAFETPFKNIGMWHGKDDHAAWTVDVKAAGLYDVTLEWACHPDSAGSAMLVDFDGQIVRSTVASTGGWDHYQRKSLGQVKLAAGACRVVVKPDGPLKTRALLDLRSLTLTPAKLP